MSKTKPVIETHGKIEDEKFQPMLLEQVWGVDNLSRYGTLDESKYSERLLGMTRADLESHARQMGVVVVEHSNRLREKLLSEFKTYVAMTRRPMNQHPSLVKLSDAALKVLSEGK